jgi:hypothetical protein
MQKETGTWWKRVEAEPRSDEQEKEKLNTKHKENGILANEINERFRLQKRIDQSILNRKNSLAEILMRGS